MKNFTILTLIVCMFSGNLFGQAQTVCPVNEESGHETSSAVNCIVPDEIFNENTIVYLRMNMHFFIGENCDGENFHLGQSFDLYSLYQYAEDFVNNANYHLANNQPQWQAVAWGAPFNPPHEVCVRYVLKGVHIHCATVIGDPDDNTSGELQAYTNNLNNIPISI